MPPDSNDTFFRGQRVLVTGACGFIGSHLVAELVDRGADVLGLDREQADLPAGFAAPLRTLDLADVSETVSVFRDFRPHLVYHLAAAPDGPEDFEQVLRSINGGLLLTVNLLEAFRQFPGNLFVFADSSKVYGDPGVGYRESLPEDPRSSYAIAKSAAWQFCRYHRRLYQTNVVSVRPTLVYGPGQPRNIISYVIDAVLSGQDRISLMGGRQTRDPLFYQDLIRAYLLLPRHFDRISDRVINLGGGQEISVLDLVHKIVGLMGARDHIEVEVTQARPTDSLRSFSENSEAFELLGWQPETGLDEGLLALIAAATDSLHTTGK